MRKGAFILVFFASAALARLAADEMRFVDGRLVRVLDSAGKTENQEKMQEWKAPEILWNSSEWEMPSSGRLPHAEASTEQKPEGVETLSGESLSEKLARISRQKLQELDEPKQALALPQETNVSEEKLNPEIIEVAPPPPPPAEPKKRVVYAPIPESVGDSEVEALEDEYALLLKKIREREASIKEKEAAQEETPKQKEALQLPLPEERPKSVESATAFADEESRSALDAQIRERLEADMKAAETDKPEIKEEKLPNYYTFSGECFNVLSSNYEARELGVSVAKTIEETYAGFFGAGNIFPSKVNLQMLLEDEAKFSGYFHVITDSSITISVKCGPGLPLDKFVNLASDAYLSALSVSVKGGYASAPYWLNLGLKAALAQNFAMGVSYEMARAAAANTPDKLGDVVKYSKGDKKPLEFKEISAYWNLAALKFMSGNAANFENLMKAILVGEDTEKLLDPIKKRMGETFDAQMRAVMLGEIYSRVGGVKNFEDSDRELTYLFAIQKQQQGEASLALSDIQIFERRKELENEIATRLTEIKLALPWANPVYYNAYVALGKMFTAAQDSDSDAFETARKDFAIELRKSRAASDRVIQLLDPAQVK